jgi:hypothetical protein
MLSGLVPDAVSPDPLPWPGRIAAHMGPVAPTCRSLGDRAFIVRACVAVIANVARVAGRRLTAAKRPAGVFRTRSLPRPASGPSATVACRIAYLCLPNRSAREDGL